MKTSEDKNTFRAQLERMVEDQIKRCGIQDKRLLNALLTVERHRFVEPEQRHLAYFDGPLPIGHGQTISQPYIVAFMTAALKIESQHKILEIGTGCGYQTAILAKLSTTVISLEYIKSLADSARLRLSNLGYKNITVHNANGQNGWPAAAPFDRIIGTAAPTSIPEKLVEQLAPSGKMIIPIGDTIFNQSLFIISKSKHGKVKIKRSLGVRFVPMVG